MPEFPYFKSNMSDFPSLNGLDGQSYRDTFDYSKYQRPAVLRLLSVPWKSDYADVVRFSDERSRDSWLTNHDGLTVEYSTPWLKIPAQSVNVPLPYERAAHFNYLYVDIPQMPVDDSNEPTRLCYFIRSVGYAAPSTTTIELELDFWQTYGYRMEVSSLMLERGHAPMYRVSVDEFLEDPINTNRYLLAQDVNYSTGSDRVASVDHRDIGAGDKWLLLALPITPGDLANIGAGAASSSTPPAYSDTAARNGYQLAVSGYNWSANGYSYANATLPASSGLSSDSRTLDGCKLYACPYRLGASASLASMAIQAPHVLASVRYVAIIPEALIEPENISPISIFGATWYSVKANPQVEIKPFELTRENINLPDYAADIAKLYTAPYTRLMIQDQEGRGFEVRIEDIAGNELEFNMDVALSSASLLWNIEAVNIGTDSAESITWKTLDGETASTLYGSDLAAHMLEWGIPTYSVTLSAGALEAARKWKDLEAQRQAALNTYHQAVRAANTSLANTQATNYTINTNAGNTARTNSSNTTATNQAATDNTTEETTARSGIAGWQNTTTTSNKDANNSLNDDRAKTANDIQALSLVQSNQLAAISAATSIGASITGVAGSVMTGNPQGAAAGTANVIGTAVVTHTAITNDSNLSQAVQDANTYMKNRAASAATDISINTNALNSNTVSYQNDQATHTTTNNNTLRSTLTTNNNSLLTGNTSNTTGTSDSNASYTRADSVTAAKENLEQAQRAAENALKSASMSLVDVGSTTGDNALDALARRAFTIKAVTQSDYALRATADYFTRYGYALNAPIYPNSWLEQGEWCYWKGSRAIIKGDVPDMYRTALEGLFERGFTVWATPEEVGNYGL